MKSREEAIEWAKRAPAPHEGQDREIEERKNRKGAIACAILVIYETAESGAPPSQEEVDKMGTLRLLGSLTTQEIARVSYSGAHRWPSASSAPSARRRSTRSL